MAIFNMQRFFEDDTSTCSVIFSPDGEHLCCALEQGPLKRIAIGKHRISEIGLGRHDSDAAVKVAWHVVKSPRDKAYRIPNPKEISDMQRPHEDAYDMLMGIMGPDDEIRIVPL